MFRIFKEALINMLVAASIVSIAAFSGAWYVGLVDPIARVTTVVQHQRYELLAQHTVIVSVSNGWGSGVIISDGLVVTNYHVAHKRYLQKKRVKRADGFYSTKETSEWRIDKNILIQTYDGRRYKAKVKRAWREHDLALLEVEDLKAPTPLILSKESEIPLHARVYSMGHGNRNWYQLEMGFASRYMIYDGDELWKGLYQFTTFDSEPGDSGSPIFNEQNELIGILCGTTGIGKPGIIIPLEKLRLFLDDNY